MEGGGVQATWVGEGCDPEPPRTSTLCLHGGRLPAEGSGCKVQGSGFRVQGLVFRVQSSGFRVQGSVFFSRAGRIPKTIGVLGCLHVRARVQQNR